MVKMQIGAIVISVVRMYLEKMTSLGSHSAVPTAFSAAQHGAITQTLHNF